MPRPRHSTDGVATPTPERIRNPMACEPCRQRKVKCNGERPCRGCRDKPSACTYRLKARRYRRLRSSSPPPARDVGRPRLARVESRHGSISVPGLRPPREFSSEEPSPQVHHSVAAIHHAPQPTDSSQLFYGPSSNFAFLRQIHRAIISRGPHGDSRAPRESARDESSLDMFMQRIVFFGVPLRVDPTSAMDFDPRSGLGGLVPRDDALIFLQKFKAASLHMLPFFSPQELDDLSRDMYAAELSAQIPPLKRASFLMVLAIGALGTAQTELADTLFLAAKRESAVFEEAVTLPVIQLSLLIADYQLNMGRPSSAYIHVGNACRKGLAFGLDTAVPNTASHEMRERSCTLWSLYFFETWLSYTVGRRSVIRREDIGCPYPADQPVLANLCDLALIVEDSARSLWLGKSDTLSQLHDTAQELHERLRKWGLNVGIGSVRHRGASEDPMGRLTLHNVYFHLIHTTFRPFLIAESALHAGGSNKGMGELWLRQACRNATDAASDSIDFMHTMFQGIDASTIRRYDSFFVEACSSVLLFDSLRHPSKHPNNLVYINKGLHCLERMTADEPVTNVILSVRRILDAVEVAIFEAESTPGEVTQLPTPSAGVGTSEMHAHTPLERPLLEQPATFYPTSEPIHFRERSSFLTGDASLYDMGSGPRDQGALHGQPWSQFNLDVVTTDLFNFFPRDLCQSPPEG